MIGRYSFALLLAAVLVGCSGNADKQNAVIEDFSAEGFEKEMREAGKAEEFEDAKRRADEYQAGSNSQEEQQKPGGP